MTNYLIIARAWFRTRPWPIRAWIAVCAVAGAVLGLMVGNRLTALLLASPAL